MSARDVALVLNHSKSSGSQKLVLLGIAWHMSDTWNEGAWPSIERLATYAGVSTRQVIRSIAALEESGELDVDRHNGRSYGGPKTNRYWVTVECDHDCDGSMQHRPLEEIVPMFEVVDNFDTRDIQGSNR
jgi:hypothetical protein